MLTAVFCSCLYDIVVTLSLFGFKLLSFPPGRGWYSFLNTTGVISRCLVWNDHFCKTLFSGSVFYFKRSPSFTLFATLIFGLLSPAIILVQTFRAACELSSLTLSFRASSLPVTFPQGLAVLHCAVKVTICKKKKELWLFISMCCLSIMNVSTLAYLKHTSRPWWSVWRNRVCAGNCISFVQSHLLSLLAFLEF